MISLRLSYSVDFCYRVLSIRKKEGLTLEQTSQRFRGGRAVPCRWLRRRGSNQSRPRKRKIKMVALAEDVRTHPEAYLHERAARFGLFPNAIFTALRRLGVTYKSETDQKMIQWIVQSTNRSKIP